jgi:hypothetical protein
MYIQMLKNQQVSREAGSASQTTFVSDVAQAEQYSPFFMWHNPQSGCYVVSKRQGLGYEGVCTCVAAGLTKEEAEACVMFKANEFILRRTGSRDNY